MKNSDYNYLTIEPAKYGRGWAVKGHKRRKSGVLKGQMMAHYIESFDELEDAQEAYPEASTGSAGYGNTFHHLPEDNDPPVGKRMKPNGLYE